MMACVLSCRSVKNVGSVEQHHYSNGADTLVAVSISERTDSSSYFRSKIDSLSVELARVRDAYHSLYEKDSINEVLHMKDSISVKDTTWLQVNADGSVTYHNYREKNTYSWQQLERYKQQIVRESQATIDSLIERNTLLQERCDSISNYRSLADSASVYKAKADSLSDIIREKEQTTIVKKDIWGDIKASIVMVLILLAGIAFVYVYLRFIRR